MLINAGYGNYVVSDKITAIVDFDSAPVKRLVREAKKAGLLIDATRGHKTRSIIMLVNNQIIACANLPETIAEKLGGIS